MTPEIQKQIEFLCRRGRPSSVTFERAYDRVSEDFMAGLMTHEDILHLINTIEVAAIQEFMRVNERQPEVQ